MCGARMAMRNRIICAAALIAAAWCLAVPVVEDLEAQAAGVFLAVEPELAQSASRSLLEPTTDTAPRTLRSRLVRVDFGQLDIARADTGRSAGDVVPLTLNLFDDTVFAAHVESTTSTQSGYVLSGRLIGEPFGTMTLVVNGTVVAGTVRTLEGTWRIRTAGAGLYRIRQVDLSTLPPEGEPLAEPAAADYTSGGDTVALPLEGEQIVRSANSDDALIDVVDVTAIDGPEIDMIIFYTPEARDHEGGTAEIEAAIELFVAETNQAYADSGVLQRLNLVRQEELDYFEAGDLREDFGRFTDPLDGHVDDVYTLRDAYAADLMHLVTLRDTESEGDPCGLAVSVVSAGSVQDTSSVTSVDCGAMTFAHELGHNMGLKHDRYTEHGGNNLPYPYSVGYVNQRAFDSRAPESSRWRTVMAYNDQCDNAGFHCTQLFRFSNPDQTYSGDPLGVPGDEPSNTVDGPADARRSLNNLRSHIANFRNSRDRILCRPVLFPERQIAPIDGGTFEVAVTIRHDCTWTAVADAEFVSVTRGAGGTGSGVVEYEIDANSGPERVGQLVIAGRAFPIDQPGPDSGGTCGRTAQVMKAITDAARIDHCWDVTSEHLAAIYDLRLEEQQISALLPDDFSGLSGLLYLNLSRNDLTSLPEGVFAGLSNLISLQLYRNSLTELPEGIFTGLSNLQRLSLASNRLTTVPGELFAGLSNLEQLQITSNDLTALPEGVFAGLSSLQNLIISDNRLSALPETVFAGLTNLDTLWLGNNELAALPEGVFAGLASLKTLLVSGNKLTTLPEDIFAGPTSLERIWLGGNELTALPEEIFSGLSNLDNLSVGVNRLRSLPDQVFAGLSRLGYLNLSGNELTALPPRIFADVPALDSLWLDHNELNALPAGIFSGLSNLRNLELNDNPGAPFTLTLDLVVTERTSTGGAVAVEVVEGAPFTMTLALTATGGTLSARTATIGAGETASPDVVVTREAPTVTIRPGTPPSIPQGSGCGLSRCFRGLQLAAGESVELSN